MSEHKVRVVFTPSGRRGSFPVGTPLLQAAQALGVDIDVYLNSERSLEIQQHIDRCAACDNTTECDDKLAGQAIAPDNIGFCNNEASLREIAKK